MDFQKDIHYSLDFERSTLGACLLEKSAFSRTFGTLESEMFYSSGHQTVYEAMKRMHHNGQPIDILTVVDELIRRSAISIIDSYNTGYFITKLTNDVVNTTHLEFHSHIIKTMWIEREIIKITHGGIRLDGTARSKIGELQLKLSELNKINAESDWLDMSELMVDLYKHQNEMENSDGIGLTTGIRKLDRMNGGYHPGNMIVLGARPSMGKTAWMTRNAIMMAKAGNRVGIISLEMSNNEIAARLAALDSSIDFNTVYRGLYKDENDRQKLYNSISKSTSQLPIFVTDKTGVNINDIRAKASKLQHKHGLDCLMIDYLQLISSDESRNRNREQEISQISRGVKIMAKEMNIPVIVLAQLNREVTKRKGDSRYPELSDLRESGSLEQDADAVLFLHRDWMAGIQADENGKSTETDADLIVRKWRNGDANMIIRLHFDPTKMMFTEKGENKWQPVDTQLF